MSVDSADRENGKKQSEMNTIWELAEQEWAALVGLSLSGVSAPCSAEHSTYIVHAFALSTVSRLLAILDYRVLSVYSPTT